MRRILRDWAHLIRPALVLLAGVALFLVIRAAVVPKAFGKYGHYRPGALELVRQRPIGYAGQDTCILCHDDEARQQRDLVGAAPRHDAHEGRIIGRFREQRQVRNRPVEDVVNEAARSVAGTSGHAANASLAHAFGQEKTY